MGSFEDPSNTSQMIVGEEMVEELLTEARLRAEEEVEGNKNNKRRRPSEKDRNKEDEEDEKDEEDKEDLPESKKAKKSPEKTKTRKRGRPSGKDKDKEDEDISESKKVKKAPKKKINLKKKTRKERKMYILSGGVPSGNSLGGCGSRETLYTTGLNLQKLPCLSQGRRGNEGDQGYNKKKQL